MQKVLDGVVENYLTVADRDPSLTATSLAADALSCHDVLQHAQYTKGHFALMSYAKTTVAAVHTLCSVSHLREQIAFPKA